MKHTKYYNFYIANINVDFAVSPHIFIAQTFWIVRIVFRYLFNGKKKLVKVWQLISFPVSYGAVGIN